MRIESINQTYCPPEGFTVTEVSGGEAFLIIGGKVNGSIVQLIFNSQGREVFKITHDPAPPAPPQPPTILHRLYVWWLSFWSN